MTVWLYVMGIESKIVEVWELDKGISRKLVG
jgi:hypothetical protein